MLEEPAGYGSSSSHLSANVPISLTLHCLKLEYILLGTFSHWYPDFINEVAWPPHHNCLYLMSAGCSEMIRLKNAFEDDSQQDSK
nr:hypothetical protein Itr_chr01CG02700 [Ipomoea trifida]